MREDIIKQLEEIEKSILETKKLNAGDMAAIVRALIILLSK